MLEGVADSPGGLVWRLLGPKGRLASISSGYGSDERSCANHIDHPFDVVGQHVQRHFRSHVFQSAHLEMSCAHPRLDGSERMLDRASPGSHEARIVVHSGIHSFDQMLVLPACDPPFLARCALCLEGA